jgi:hypothetical protein
MYESPQDGRQDVNCACFPPLPWVISTAEIAPVVAIADLHVGRHPPSYAMQRVWRGGCTAW